MEYFRYGGVWQTVLYAHINFMGIYNANGYALIYT